MFKRLLTLKDVSPVFTEYVQAFGTKVTGEDDPFFGSYTRKVSFPLNGNLRSENDHYGMINHPFMMTQTMSLLTIV